MDGPGGNAKGSGDVCTCLQKEWKFYRFDGWETRSAQAMFAPACPATGSANWPPDDTSSIMILRLVLIEALSPLEVYYILHIGRSVKQFFRRQKIFPLAQWENCVMKNMSLSSAVFSLRIRIRIRVSENSESECLRLSSRILLVVGIKLLAWKCYAVTNTTL